VGEGTKNISGRGELISFLWTKSASPARRKNLIGSTAKGVSLVANKRALLHDGEEPSFGKARGSASEISQGCAKGTRGETCERWQKGIQCKHEVGVL